MDRITELDSRLVTFAIVPALLALGTWVLTQQVAPSAAVVISSWATSLATLAVEKQSGQASSEREMRRLRYEPARSFLQASLRLVDYLEDYHRQVEDDASFRMHRGPDFDLWQQGMSGRCADWKGASTQLPSLVATIPDEKVAGCLSVIDALANRAFKKHQVRLEDLWLMPVDGSTTGPLSDARAVRSLVAQLENRIDDLQAGVNRPRDISLSVDLKDYK